MNTSSPSRRLEQRGGWLSAVLLTIATIPCAAHASIDATPRVVVGLRDLDWTSPLTAQHVYAHVRHAAVRVCNQYIGPLSAIRTRESACYTNAVRHAVAVIDNPLVTALAVETASR